RRIVDAAWAVDHPACDRQRADDRGRHSPLVGGIARVRDVGSAESPKLSVKAVIFDLWETLIDWDRESAARMLQEVDELVGNGFAERWDSSNLRYVAPIRTALAEADVPEELIEDIC